MFRRLALLLVVISACSVAAAFYPPGGGLHIIPGYTAYDVTIINKLGYDVRIKFVGFRDDAYFATDLGNGQSVERDFYSGQRVMCVWNESSNLVMAATVDVNANGILELKQDMLPTYTTLKPLTLRVN